MQDYKSVCETVQQIHRVLFVILEFLCWVLESMVYLYEQTRKRMNIFFRQRGTLVHWVPSKHVDKQCTAHVFFKESMYFSWAYNVNCVPNQGYVASTIICFMRKVIWKIFWDNEVISIGHALRKRNLVVSHDRCVDIQKICDNSSCHMALFLAPKCW